jgi:putative FmdB family regulatory protein
MPLYEYVCQDCGERFERLVRGSADTQKIRCPRCESDTVARAFSTFATAGVRSGETAPACGPVG